MANQPRAGRNTQWHSTRRAGQNIQPTNKSKKLDAQKRDSPLGLST